jgi:phenylpropionate dioxygenase-like ring-hydroxylating dioxygenase large terminal subunit
MFIKNCWYVAAWSSEVEADGLLARTILEMPVVLWRDEAENVIAFEDRCCHRGAPLSKGRREGNCVRCMYHGLKFDKSGSCVEIPGQQRIPPSAKVTVFPVVERHKWIWIWMGDPAKADVDLIPDTHWLDDPAWRSQEGYTHYATNYLLIADNLLDLAHLPYVHPSTLGGAADYAENVAKVESIARGVRVTRWALNTAVPAFVQEVRPYDGDIDRWNIYDFVIPGIFIMDSGVSPAGSGAPDGVRVNAAEFHGCQALTPETENSTHYFFAHPHNFAIDRPEVTASIHESVVTAFKEDKEMVTAQAGSLALKPDFKMIPIAADAALGRFRHIVNAMISEEKEPSPASIPVRAATASEALS